MVLVVEDKVVADMVVMPKVKELVELVSVEDPVVEEEIITG